MMQLPPTIHEIRAEAVLVEARVLELRSCKKWSDKLQRFRRLTQVEIAAEVDRTQARVSQILSKNKEKGRKRPRKPTQLRPRFAGVSNDGYAT
jgi:hypothetical protein